jgi:4-hydroxythreonine-4-phosphate dehydrogenase
MTPKHILITAGDPFGIGPEITVKALKKFKNKGLRFSVIGERAAMLAAGWHDALGTLIEIQSVLPRPRSSKPSKYSGDISYRAVMAAIYIMNTAAAAALVTAPVSKEAWMLAGVKFTGHTEVFKKYAAAKACGALMMFNAGKINCATVTEHFAVKDLSRVLTKERIIESAKLFAAALGGKEAQLALSALNPHAGDGGKTGSEEIKIITPAAFALKKQGYNITGPYPVDSLWQKHACGKFDGILCMYHDAALLGLKLAAKTPVVHITAGLKWPRVSPAHGTAFDIAGKNIADESSMLAALTYAASLP